MLINSQEIMKAIDERERCDERCVGGGGEAIVKGWELNDFFKSNLELALSIILKQRIIWIKLCCGGM